jgi:hypothetical protein
MPHSKPHLFLYLVIIISGCTFFGTSSRDQAQEDHSIDSDSSKCKKTFSVDFETVWSAALFSLDDMPLEKIDKKNGIIKTGWIEGWSQKKSRGVLTNRFMDDYLKERYRIILIVSGSSLAGSVTVRSQVQEKQRGGSAAYRWERKKSSGEKEKKILIRLEEILSGKARGF